jgi:hypothetical protein
MASTESTATDYSHVIDWTEAMEQCGDDEDFLRELLSDLRGEIDAQIVKIDAVLEVSESERWALSLALVLGVSCDAIFISMYSGEGGIDPWRILICLFCDISCSSLSLLFSSSHREIFIHLCHICYFFNLLLAPSKTQFLSQRNPQKINPS